MSEPILIQQREILHALRQAQARQAQITTAADAEWQQIQRTYEEMRAILAWLGEEQTLTSAPTTPPAAPPNANPPEAFRQSAERISQIAAHLRSSLWSLPWRQTASWKAHGKFLGLTYVGDIAFSPDGRLLASGSGDRTVKIWEVPSGRLLRTLSVQRPVISVAFSPDGRLLASGSRIGIVGVWEVASGYMLHTLGEQIKQDRDDEEKHFVITPSLLGVAFSPDGRLLASGSADKTVKVWEVASGRLLHTLIGHKDWTLGVAFSPDGRLLASGSNDKTVKLWEVSSGRLLYTLSGHRGTVLSVAFSPDGRLLASGSADKTVKVWEVASGRLLYNLSGHNQVVWKVAFSPDGRLLASGSNPVKVWDVISGDLLHTLSGYGDCVAFSPDGRLLALTDRSVITLLTRDGASLRPRIAALAQAMTEARFWYTRWQEQVAAEYQRALRENILNTHRRWLEDFSRLDFPGALHWRDARWQTWTVGAATGRGVLRFGEIQARLSAEERLEMPTLLAFPGYRSLLFKGPSRATVVGAIQSLLLRLLATIPPGKLRFTFIDPVGLGQNVAPFMALADYDEQLVTARAWSDPRHIEQRLSELTEHIETVIQKYLRHEYATIEEYNEKAGEIAEPYRILVVFDFPANFNEETARRLLSIVQNGPRCGVYTIILMDPDRPLPYDFNAAELERACTVIAWKDGRWAWEDDDFRECTLELDGPPPMELFNRIIAAVGERAKEASKVEVPIERILPPREQWWQERSLEGLNIPLGPAGARKVQELALGKGTAQHVLVAGKTGSGKSTLLHVLITNLALRYSPEEVQVYLVDFKKGVEFKPYATYNLPHARVVAIESEREFGLSVLQGLDAELKRRGDLFRAAGVDHIADYRTRTGQPMPRILLIVDEFQEFFTEDDPIASQAAQVLDRLVRQGRAFGVHVLLGSQTLAGSYTLARSTIDQMAVRIALQCSEADSRLILADDNPAARLLSRPGEAIYNDANGLVEGNHPFQVAWLSDEQREKYLQEIAALAAERRYRPPQPQIVFEGNAPAEVEKNRPLADLLAAPTWPSRQRRVSAWLGEPIAIADPTAAYFRRQSGSNLLIVGQNDEAAAGMMAVALISLAAQHAPQDATFYVLDFGAVDAPHAGVWDTLAAALPHTVKIGRRRQLPDIIGELAAEVERRLDNEQPGAPSLYLFLYGLQRARDLRQEEMGFGGFTSFGEEPAAPNLARQFVTILREGPDLGIHTVVWCDTVTNLNRSLDRRSLREVAMRVVFQMSAEDSANLIDSPAASKLGPYRALFYDEDEGQLEKFRPYGIPSAKWLEYVKGCLASR
ncbi:MAG: AAA family ATPase [Thermoflexales bacterium]|nr:AAA family ATPase [Thermoflexales bacterium]